MKRSIGTIGRAIVLTLAFGGLAVPAHAVTYPTGFSHTVIAASLDMPTGLAFFPDGRIAIAQKSGVVRLVKSGQLLETPLIDLSDHVNDYWDRGLLGIAVDPDFASNPYVYLLYVYENGRTGYTESKTSRLTRVKVTGDTADPETETVLLGGNVDVASCSELAAGSDCIPADAPFHSVGAIKFSGSTIFVAVGDAADFGTERALQAQDLDSLAGKLLRVGRDGRGVSSNPFWNGDAGANRSKVWAYGFRNPFRFNPRPGSSVVYVGDVGWDTRDEVNVVVAGANHGWPCYEGAGRQDVYGGDPICQALYARTGSAQARKPIVEYGPGEFGFAVIGGTFVTNSTYPSRYQGAYFFADYAQGWIRTLRVDGNNALVSGSVADFAKELEGPVDVQIGPNGLLYYLAIGIGELRRIEFSEGNTPPVAVINADITSGLMPLAVRFTSTGSSDPDRDRLTYTWDFGDGTIGQGTQLTHTYRPPDSGMYQYVATLTVHDSRGGVAQDSVTITVGNRRPGASIQLPARGTRFKVGDVIMYSASSKDPEDGFLTDSSVGWQVLLHHCRGGDCHTHPFLHTTGTSGSFTVPDHDDQFYFELVFTAVDSVGLTRTISRSVKPR